ncbi:DDX1, partial [Cervus elaphus hippelaphus]
PPQTTPAETTADGGKRAAGSQKKLNAAGRAVCQSKSHELLPSGQVLDGAQNNTDSAVKHSKLTCYPQELSKAEQFGGLLVALCSQTLAKRRASDAALRPHLPGVMFYLLRSVPVPVHHLRHRQPGAPVPQQRRLCGVQKLTFIRKTWLNHHSAGHRKDKQLAEMLGENHKKAQAKENWEASGDWNGALLKKHHLKPEQTAVLGTEEVRAEGQTKQSENLGGAAKGTGVQASSPPPTAPVGALRHKEQRRFQQPFHTDARSSSSRGRRWQPPACEGLHSGKRVCGAAVRMAPKVGSGPGTPLSHGPLSKGLHYVKMSLTGELQSLSEHFSPRVLRKMAPKAKKEAPAPPKAEAKAKALKAKKAANKHQIKQAVKKLYDIDVAKVNTLIRPDGEKKAYNAELKFNFGEEEFKFPPKDGFVALSKAPESFVVKSQHT